MEKEETREQPLRVLHVFGRLNFGGAESRTVELYRAIDRNRVQFDFLVHTDARGKNPADTSSETLAAAREKDDFDDELRSLGARIFAVPRFHGSNYAVYRKALQVFFSAHCGEWAAVHGHMTSTAPVYLKIAGACGVPLLIAHARSAGVDPGLKGIVTNLLRRPLRKTDCPYVRLAVSGTAGTAVFGEAAMRDGYVHVIPNAIRTERFAYDAAARERVRMQHGIPSGAFVMGHVGSFRVAKNHEFLLRVFAAWKRMYETGMLLLVGEGERMREMRALAEREGVAKDVIFAGNQRDIPACMQAMDVFVFPSRYEGMPGSVLEAQAAGLPCLVSDAVTKEVVRTALVRQMPLTETPENWAGAVHGMYEEMSAGLPSGREEASAAARQKLAAAGFDIRLQAKRMTRLYVTGVLTDASGSE